MRVVLLLQLITPVVLVGWILLAPPRTATGYTLQLASTVLALWAIRRIGIWMFPPWWTIPAAAVILSAGISFSIRGRRFHALAPKRGLSWLHIALFFSVGVVSASTVRSALRGQEPPESLEVIDLDAPLAPGSYLVVNGGSDPSINTHQLSLDPTRRRLQPWRGNGYAVDLVALNSFGVRANGILPSDPARYEIFGAKVLAPCAGVVFTAVDGHADMRVPIRDATAMAGNHIILVCGAYHVILAHLQRHSLTIQSGDSVYIGQSIARVGNSGLTDEPHLHIHVQQPGPAGTPMAGDPLPFRFNGRFPVRGDRLRFLANRVTD